MKYIVIEIQVNQDGTVGNIVTSYDSLNSAESHYYTVRAAAAVSELPKHSAVIVDDEGGLIGARCYRHGEE